MWQGTYQKWNPVPEYADQRFYVDAVHDDWEGFRIWFRLDKSTGIDLIVRFDYALLYLNSIESFRLSSVEGKLSFPHLFWKVENSQLIEEFHRQSLETCKGWEIEHFAFLSALDCVDVLSVSEPVFDNLNEDVD
jgi:hypothetical protein